MLLGVYAGLIWAALLCKRHWTMLAELGLTATLSSRMELAIIPTQF